MIVDDELKEAILETIFLRINDPAAICRIVDKNDGGKDLVYVNVNDAYEKINNMKREDLVGASYSSVWKDDISDWAKVMISVAETGLTGFGTEYGGNVKSGFFEAESIKAPGFWQLFIFSPIQDWVFLIFRDMAEWRKVALQLQKNEKALRRLVGRLTLAEEKVRRDIAARLHDGIGYSMVSMLHSLRGLKELDVDKQSKDKIEALIREQERLIAETRAFTFNISPPLLYEVGLSAAVEARCEHLSATYGINCRFKSEGAEHGLDQDTQIMLYQMTSELLTNIVKHAAAANIVVIIRWGMKKIQIFVEDNGKGFNPYTAKKHWTKSGTGLFSIKERLYTVGGEMKILSAPGEGTTISLIVPLHLGTSQ